MTKQGKYNLLGVILLPVAAVLAGAIATANGVWEAYGKTYGFLFGLNFVFMLVVALFSGLLLLWAAGDKSRWLAVAPTLLTAGVGAVWYIWSAIFPSAVAPGWQFIGVPQYLLTVAAVSLVVVLVMRLTGIVSKTA